MMKEKCMCVLTFTRTYISAEKLIGDVGAGPKLTKL